MLVTLGPSAMISDLNLLLFYDDTCCLWSYLQVVYTYRYPEPEAPKWQQLGQPEGMAMMWGSHVFT
jgi:hypothetical protein